MEEFLIPATTRTCKRNLGEHKMINYQLDACYDPVDIDLRSLVQVKSLGAENVIYCNNLTIEIYGQILKCPEYSFRISSNESFAIGIWSYSPRSSISYCNIQDIGKIYY